MTDDRGSDPAAVLIFWWRLTWRMALVGVVLTALAEVALGRIDDSIPSVRFPVVLLVSLWAVRAILRRDLVPWSAVLAAWWALVWRATLARKAHQGDRHGVEFVVICIW